MVYAVTNVKMVEVDAVPINTYDSAWLFTICAFLFIVLLVVAGLSFALYYACCYRTYYYPRPYPGPSPCPPKPYPYPPPPHPHPHPHPWVYGKEGHDGYDRSPCSRGCGGGCGGGCGDGDGGYAYERQQQLYRYQQQMLLQQQQSASESELTCDKFDGCCSNKSELLCETDPLAYQRLIDSRPFPREVRHPRVNKHNSIIPLKSDRFEIPQPDPCPCRAPTYYKPEYCTCLDKRHHRKSRRADV